MKEKVQVFGRFLSGMVMPNIGAFIAWGLITALFIPTGWYPNEALGALVSPMASMLLPLLIAYTGGSVVYGQRGGVIGAIASMGVIVGSGVPMFIGAMIVGPISAWVIKQFDRKIESKIPAGFEMLVNNFSLGIIGAILTVIALKGVVPFVEVMNRVMESGVGFFVDRKLLPLASIFIEPAKILFLNNAINHGILSPLGIQQVEEIGKSIFFLLEANPGPGLGVLLAYCLAGKGSAKSSAPGAIIIHFLGGIHEIYFPYILMNPLLLLEMTPRGGSFGVLAGVTVATVVSFLVALPLLRFAGKGGDLEESTEKVKQMKQESKGNQAAEKKVMPAGSVKKIVFACDAGMGSSAMGATILKKKLAAAGFGEIEVVHSPVSSIPKDAQIVVTHKELKERAAHSNPEAELILITNFMAAPEYDELVETLKNKQADL